MIEILNYQTVDKGSLVARFNVRFQKWGGLIVKDCTLFESNGKKWINLPSKQYEHEGKKKYASYLVYEDRTMNEKFQQSILHAALEAREKEKAMKPQAPVQQMDQQDEFPF